LLWRRFSRLARRIKPALNDAAGPLRRKECVPIGTIAKKPEKNSIDKLDFCAITILVKIIYF
jgi:hypothetical protein